MPSKNMVSRDEVNKRRRARYHRVREQVSAANKRDRVECPLCAGITFRRLYLKTHLANRHCLPAPLQAAVPASSAAFQEVLRSSVFACQS